MCWVLLILGVCVFVAVSSFAFGWQDGGLWRQLLLYYRFKPAVNDVDHALS
jgi:hypothetical protein